MEKNVLSQFKNNIPQYLWWKGLDCKFLGCNKNFAEYAGFKEEKYIIGKTDYDYWSKEEADQFRKIDEEVLATGVAQLNFEECMTTPNKGKRWLSTSKIPWYNDKNEIIGTIGWFNDITTLKEMQIQLDENNKTLHNYSFQLERANRDLEIVNMDLKKFTYAASHDLKEPVRTMKMFSTLLKNKKNQLLDDESKEYIDFIYNSAKRMELLIDDVLSYASTGSKKLKSKHIVVSDIVSEKLIDLKDIIANSSATININLPSKKINCYPHLIGLIFYNLINNGIKFNKSSTPIINCNYIETDEYWIFSVEDNGIGIDSKQLKQVFEPFKRLGGANYEGTGLGLSICQRVAHLHDGTIWIEESSKGTTIFKFSISKKL